MRLGWPITLWHTQLISETTAASRWVSARMRIDGAVDIKLYRRARGEPVRFLVPSDILGPSDRGSPGNYDAFWGADDWARGVPVDVAAELLRQLFRHG